MSLNSTVSAGSMADRPSIGGTFSSAKTVVLLVNLGTPAAPTSGAVRSYLREFLSDRRVVELPRWFWWAILNGVVLPLRCRQVAQKYKHIWLNDSPLRQYSEAQALALQQSFTARGEAVTVVCAMRYGAPSLAEIVDQLCLQGVERLLLLPLYPQYSATTTASVVDLLGARLAKLRNQPALRTVKDYYQHPAYIAALCTQIQTYWKAHGAPNFSAGEKLLLSFHGLPQRCVDRGDPYYQQCCVTAQRLGEALNLNAEQVVLSFQSRFGKARWLQPYTNEVLAQLGRIQTTRLDVFCPGFPADCLETLEEIAIEGRQIFVEAGGGAYHFIPCLNLAPAWLQALDLLAREHLHGWIEE